MIHEDKGHGRYMAEILVQVNALIERGVAIKTLDERLKDRTSEHQCRQDAEGKNIHVEMQNRGREGGNNKSKRDLK